MPCIPDTHWHKCPGAGGFVIACIDASNGDLGLAKEAAFWTMRVLSVPQSTIQKLYFEQIGLKAEEADAMSAQQLVERYAKYKMRRAGGAIAFAYNDEQLENKIAKYSSDAADYVSSAIIRENADREFFSVFDSLKDMEKKINELRQDNSKKSREELTKIYLSRDYSVYQWFMPMVDSIAEESANFLKAKDQKEGLIHYNKANEIVNDISKRLRGEIQSDSYIKWQYMMLTEDWIPMVNDAVKSMKVTSDKDLKSQAEKIALENEKKINSLDSVYHVDYCKPVENPKVGKDGRLHEWSYPREFTEERNAIKREKDSIASVGTTKDKVMKYLKANPTAAGIIPEDIAETDEMIAYAYALSQGWFNGKKYVHDRIDKLQDKLAQETDPNEQVRIQDKIDAETKIFSQQMVRILNHINGDDDGFEGIPD